MILVIIGQVPLLPATHLRSDKGESERSRLEKLSVALSVSSLSRKPGSELSRLEFPVSRPESRESQSDSDPGIISPRECKE